MLRRSRSSLKTRCKVLCSRGLTGRGRLVAAPGRNGTLEKLADLESLGLGCETVTGPPSLRLMTAHLSGRRAAKLCWSLDWILERQMYNLQRRDNIHTKVSRNVVCRLHLISGASNNWLDIVWRF